MQRISAARAGIQAPEVFECLEKGELNLSTIEKLAPLLKKHESSSLVERFKGETAQEAEAMAALLNPVRKSEIRDRIKVVSVTGPEEDSRQGTLVPSSKNTDEKNLELDHRVPFALGGENSPENLRTLCAAHNLHAAY